MRVVLQPDDAVPLVAVNLWYHVGSKNDDPERTGIAHLFEHLMFEGSAHYDSQYFRPLQEAGGTVNGTTGNDRTNYYEVVPSQFLELALWMEADRMAHLLPVLTQEKFETQRAVVKNERLQRIENQPYGRVSEEIARHFYAPQHPYSWPVIGWMPHLDSCVLDDCRNFFKLHYCPNNATLAIVGSFATDQVRRWIDRYFAGIESGPARAAVTPQPAGFDSQRRLRLEDAVALGRIDLVWPTAPRFAAVEPALDLAAEILGGRSKDSRLKRRLQYDERLVVSVGAFHSTLSLGGQFGIRGYALANASLERIEQAVNDEVGKLRQTPPSFEEMERSRNEVLCHAFNRIEPALGRADACNHFIFYQGSVAPESFMHEIDRYCRLTADDVQQAVDRYLGPNRLVAIVQPTGARQARVAAAPQTENRQCRRPLPDGAGLPRESVSHPFVLPNVEQALLSNGMRVLVVRRPRLPIVDFQIVLLTGSVNDPCDRLGAARLCAEALDEGTESCSALEISRQLDRIGARMSVSAGVEMSSILLEVLAENADPAIAILADVTRRPRFASDDVERERNRLLSELAHQRNDPDCLADEAIAAAIFGVKHPYGRAFDGTLESVQQIAVADLQAFHRRQFRPDGASLLAVGDITLSQVSDMAERAFGGWRADNHSLARHWDDFPADGTDPVTAIAREQAEQSVVRVGVSSIARNDPDFFPLHLLNTVLGGHFASRLNMNLREEKGYTYGVQSSLVLRRRRGAVIVSTDVESAMTHDAVAEIIAAMVGACESLPICESELAFAKAYLSRRFPARFETNRGVLAALGQLVAFQLPDDYYHGYIPAIAAVNCEQVHAVAQRHLTADRIRVALVAHPDCVASIGQLRW